ncbi:HlyD family type I secretion periplasmic adaptor subunit [Rhodobaculum claviforme]|uniref:Membrane fusion protein (MFP) family protein n=1 Tax=Rhodobaculum claviforme TaxID=1549854 RepID=A0A934TLI7_9RHOB|nr:HlyD family type I secretion periplasmic adaptor subunit [Rhodobaculum claviforme]MBK5927726.1 secretion protein HlyD [Rhodobaculum claviforme]
MTDTATDPRPAPPLQPAEWYGEVPRSIRRHVLAGCLLLVSTFGGFSLWAFQAPLAAAVIAQGSFVATGENQVVQHLEGGIIAAILVREGDHVDAGTALVRLDDTAAQTTSRELELRQIRLEATEARLLAEHDRAPDLRFPDHLAAQRHDHEVAAILEGQEVAFTVNASGLRNDLAIIDRNFDALAFRETGYLTQRRVLEDQVALLSEELEAQEKLLERGLVRRADAMGLRRATLEGEGQIARLDAELGEIAEMRARMTSQRDRTLDEYSRASLAQLQSIQSELESVREQLRRARSVLTRTEITAPVAGTIVRLYYNTTGGVIEPGRAIAEIIPSDAPLIIEALVARADIDSVQVGQPTVVRLSALNQRTTPVLNGAVAYVSADAVANTAERRQREVYVVRVSLPPEELARVRGFSPTPGMPAEVMVQTAKRTFAQYIAKPITDSMSRAFREQ